MKKIADYSAYDTLAFAADESFQDWVWRGVEDAYWQQVIIAYPGKNTDIEDARKVLSSLRFKENWPPKELVEKSLAEALMKIERKPQTAKVVPVYKWWAAAAAILILLSGTYFLWNTSGKNQPVPVAVNNKANDIAPGGNKAILTLADGTKVILDSANTGAISKQGNVTVIKLNDGLLSYEEQKSNDIQVVYNTITTPRGGQYQLVLADGSKVWLNAASSIRFPNAFPGNDRKVEITGEAYFEVAHNEKKPFRVSVNKIEVQVLGTHFNINAYEDESTLKTTLLQGSVKVSEGKENVLIKPGEQVEVSTLDDRLVINKNVDLAEVMAWKNGRFDFSDADIKSVMRQLARWYNFNVEFKGEIKDRFHVEMTRNTNLSNVFRILEGTGGVHFEIESNKVLVMP